MTLQDWFTSVFLPKSNPPTTKFRLSVPSSYFIRFIVSWMFWNWKILFLLFFVSESKVLSSEGWPISRIQWIEIEYAGWDEAVKRIFWGPALTALVLFIPLELLSVLGYWVTKFSAFCKISIEHLFDKKAKATNKWISEYAVDLDHAQGRINNLVNQLRDEKQKYDELTNSYNSLQGDFMEIRQRNGTLESERLEKQDKEKSELYKAEATSLYSIITSSPGKDELLKTFTKAFLKISKEGGRAEINTTPELEGMVTQGLFLKDERSFSVSRVGEYFNVLVNMQTGF